MDLIQDAVNMWNKGKPFSPPVTPVATSLGSAVQFTYPPAFVVAFNRVFGNEGVHNVDAGGDTWYGLSRNSYPDIPWPPTKDQVMAIGFSDYWLKVHADKMPSALAYQALDFAYNSGPPEAIKCLQRALGVPDDGKWGEVTEAAVKAAPVAKTIKLFLAERLDLMRSLSNWSSAGKGWAGRVAMDLRYGALDS